MKVTTNPAIKIQALLSEVKINRMGLEQSRCQSQGTFPVIVYYEAFIFIKNLNCSFKKLTKAIMLLKKSHHRESTPPAD
jgi:hypothetical protein